MVALLHEARVMRVVYAVLIAASSGATACGSRTGLTVQPGDGGLSVADAQLTPPSVESGSPCTSDADCTVDAFCVTSATCDPATGCVLVARSCDDGVACTTDSCSEASRRCTNVPDDSVCPDTELCSATRGCDAFVYAVAADGHLYEARVPSGDLVDLGQPAASVGDLALGPGGVLYATDTYVLSSVDRATAQTTTIASILPLHPYSGLGTGSGELLATTDVPQVFAVGMLDGSSTPVASLPPGYGEGGDVTALGARVFVSLPATGNMSTDTLVAVNVATGGSTVIGEFGYRCVWGLATLGGVVYGLTCEGRLVTIDVTTGKGTAVARVAQQFIGAAGR